MPNPQPRVRTPRGWKTPTWGADSLALDADGSTEAWGSGSEGQVTRLPAESGFTATARGGYHRLALHGIHPLHVPHGNGLVGLDAAHLALSALGTAPGPSAKTCNEGSPCA